MDNEAEKLLIKLMLRDKEIITSLQVELQQLKELLNKSKSSKKQCQKIAELEQQIVEETKSADEHHIRLYDKIDELKTLLMRKYS